MLRLIIKGNMVQAINAATDRGIALVDPYENRWNKTNHALVETVALTNADQSTAAKWFCEPPYYVGNRGNAPYPIGTLLWYGDVGPDNRQARQINERKEM